MQKKEVTAEEYKNLALDILIDFHDLCKKNNINYTLAFGTLLGAVRHKGFIPWDDDIDVIVMREDYEKLVLTANSQLKENHKWISIETNKDFTAPLAKIIDTNTELRQERHAAEKVPLGVYMDVFVYDIIPDNLTRRKIVYRKSIFLQKAWGFCENKPSKGDFWIIKFIRGLLNKTDFARFFSLKLRKNAIFCSIKGKYAANIMFGEHFNRAVYETPIEYLQDFEDYEFENYIFQGIKNYDYWLTRWYGEYMELPPIEERVGRHEYSVYYKGEL